MKSFSWRSQIFETNVTLVYALTILNQFISLRNKFVFYASTCKTSLKSIFYAYTLKIVHYVLQAVKSLNLKKFK